MTIPAHKHAGVLEEGEVDQGGQELSGNNKEVKVKEEQFFKCS